MKIQSINFASCHPTKSVKQTRNVLRTLNDQPKEDTFVSSSKNNVSFGSKIKWGGVIGTIVGAAAGVGLTVLTGGAALPAVPVLAGVGGIGGDIAHASMDKDYPLIDFPDDYSNYL